MSNSLFLFDQAIRERYPLVAGADEAGRGPVIGPMVIAGVAVEESRIKELESLGVKDSKQLTKSQRKKLFQLIEQTIFGLVGYL